MPDRATIHPTAIIDSKAILGEGVEIGPYCILRGDVTLGPGVRLVSHVTIQGPATVGSNTVLYPGVCLGFEPQDVKFKPGMPTAGVRIGQDCLLREHVTIHAASKGPDVGHPTTIGDRCFLMVNSHLGHDTRIGNDVVMVNSVLLAGHVEVADRVTFGGGAGVHQFCRIGRLTMVSGLSACSLDIPPFVIAAERNTIFGLNVVGLRRNGFSREHITKLREAFREGFRIRRPRNEQLAVLRELGANCPPVAELADFVAASKRGVMPAATQHDENDTNES